MFSHLLYRSFLAIERALARLSMRSVTLLEGSVSYLEGGKGPTIVMLHGFGADKDHWNKLAAKLTRHYHVVAIDLPGFGDSFKEQSRQYHIKAQISRLNEIVTKLNLTDFVLCGNSYGGYLSAHYAAASPHHVKALMLLSPLGVQNAKPSKVFNDVVAGKHNYLLPRSLSEFKALFTLCFVNAPFVPNSVMRVMAEQAIQDHELRKHIFYQAHLIDDKTLSFAEPLEECLRRYAGPIHIVWGEKDYILDASGAKVLADNFPNSTVTMLANIGHLPMLETPGEVAILLKNI